MSQKIMPLANLLPGAKAKIIGLKGGHSFQKRLRVMDIREGQTIQMVSRQPFRGPVTIAINDCQMTLGRGMAQKIIVEEL